VVRALGEWHARSAHRLADSAVIAGTGFRAGDWLTFLVKRYFGLVGNHSG
jgi:hypothetical protein